MRSIVKRLAVLLFVLLSVALLFYYALFAGANIKNNAFKLGLDLSGGVQLNYKIDTANIKKEDIKDSLSALRDTIERRVNFLGVAEPTVQVEKGIDSSANEFYRLIVELPGFYDAKQAENELGKTPVLEFRLKVDDAAQDISKQYGKAVLSGAHIKRANVELIQNGAYTEPSVSLSFNDEGAEIFAKVTKENIGNQLGIFLDGELISSPVIQEAITAGTASITGSFTAQEAKELKRNLNLGAIPVPIQLESVYQVDATLGEKALESAIFASLLSFVLVLLFMVFWYGLLGVLSVVSLLFYVFAMLSIFKFVPITLTASALAGFVLSIGMALDANILIFERIKEELLVGKKLKDAVLDGFHRAWQSIRDANLSSLLIAALLFWFATGLIRGFALVFALGVFVSMLSSYYISKSIILALAELIENKKWARTLFMTGASFKIKKRN